MYFYCLSVVVCGVSLSTGASYTAVFISYTWTHFHDCMIQPRTSHFPSINEWNIDEIQELGNNFSQLDCVGSGCVELISVAVSIVGQEGGETPLCLTLRGFLTALL